VTRPNLVQTEVLRRARLDHTCPKCSASPGVRCFVMYGNDRRSAGRDKPHTERVCVAWKAYREAGR
jgi:hypothetical protein